MNQQPNSKRRELIVALSVLIIVVAIVGTVAVTNKKPAPNPGTVASSDHTASNADGNSPSTGASYKDGMYMATGMYDSPGGQESIKVSLTLQNNVVTDATVTSGANDVEAGQYQAMFIEGYKAKVVGKKIDTIKLSRVSGSSLTSQGFNSALQQIESQAKSA